MILLSNTTAQTLAPGQALTLSKLFKSRNGCECFNSQFPTSVKLCSPGDYEIHFSGNVSGLTAASPVQLSLAIGGQPLIETEMDSVPAAVGDLNNVATTTFLRNRCCDLDRISVVNTGANSITVAANSSLAIHRLS